MTDDRRKNELKTGRFQPGKPKGARHKTTLLAEKLMQDDAEKIVKAVIEAAYKGDMTAARIVLDRIAPARRDNLVAFELPKVESASEAAAASSAVLRAVASGELTPGEALDISRLNDAIEKLRGHFETERQLRIAERCS